MDDLNFAQNITMLRRRHGITQETLADFIGVTKASVSKWETGQSLPDVQTSSKTSPCFSASDLYSLVESFYTGRTRKTGGCFRRDS